MKSLSTLPPTRAEPQERKAMASALERAQQEGREPTRQAIAIDGRSAQGQVTGKLRKCLMRMVQLGEKRDDAARAVGLATHTVYVALTKPHVKAFYFAQLEVLRTSERARNIHRLAEIRDAANNMPAVQAIKALEEIDDVATGRSAAVQRGPGLQIVIMQGDAKPVVQAPLYNIERKPSDTNGSGGND
jgi:hypothetical protein